MKRESQCLFRSSGEPPRWGEIETELFSIGVPASLPALPCCPNETPPSLLHIANRIRSVLDILVIPAAWHLASYRESCRIRCRIYFGQQIARNSSTLRADRYGRNHFFFLLFFIEIYILRASFLPFLSFEDMDLFVALHMHY